jgi:cytochrome P450
VTQIALPPGPRRPAVLQGLSLAHRPFRFLKLCRDTYGDTFTITVPPLGRTVIFSQPDDFEQLLTLDGEILHGGAAQAAVVTFAGDGSLMKLDGAVHQEHREILTRVLRPASLPAGGANLLELIRRTLADWPVGKRFDLGAAVDRLGLELVTTVGFGGAPAEVMRQSKRAIRSIRRAARPTAFLLSALLPYERVRFGSVRRATERFIAARSSLLSGKSSSSEGCLFSRLAAQSTSTGVCLGVDDLRDEMMTVLTAMVGGLTCAVKHAFYWVLRTPGIQPRIRDELSGAMLAESPEQIVGRPYLDAVCKEVLRLCPDIPFAVRRAASDVAIGPWTLPAGTTIGLAIYLLHRRAASFPEPDQFIPERFLASRLPRFEYLPFGGGRRGCVAGPLFVFLEKLILAAALELYEFQLCDTRENPVTSMAMVSTPARPLWVTARRVSSRLARTGGLTVHRGDPAVVASPAATGQLDPAIGPHFSRYSGANSGSCPRSRA